MAFFKGTMLFRDTVGGKSGWSESYYLTSQVDLQTAAIDFAQLLAKRSNMLGAGILMEYASVSNDDPLDQGDVFALVPPVWQPNTNVYNPAFINTFSDYAWTAQMCRASSKNLYHRPVTLAGVPDFGTRIQDPNIKLADWVDAFNLFSAQLIGGKYAMKVHSKNLADSPISKVIDCAPLAGGGTVTVDPVIVLNPGDQVKVWAVRGKPRENRPHGIYQVKQQAAGVVTLQDWKQSTFTYDKSGYMRKVVSIVTPIDQLVMRGIRSHRRGRPFGLAVGKYKTRCPRVLEE